jgi:hypothetical protein
MSEDTQVENTNTEVEYTAVEQEALQSGWVPKDQYEGEDHKWIDAGEFLRRAPLFEKIDQQNRKIKQLDDGLKKLATHHDKVREAEYQRALLSLKSQKKAALEDQDHDAVIEIDERLAEVREKQKLALAQEEQESRQNGPAPEFVAWQQKNSWYSSDEDMRIFADAYGTKLALSGVEPVEVLKQVEAKVKQKFPTAFRNPNRDKPGAVESSRTTSKGKEADPESKLTDQEKSIMKSLIRTIPGFTKEKYIADLKTVDTEGRFK